MAPVSSGYADVNGIKLYHEIYGQGEQLVMLHGGLMTISEMSTPLEYFAKAHNVIAIELQDHGRTAVSVLAEFAVSYESPRAFHLAARVYPRQQTLQERVRL